MRLGLLGLFKLWILQHIRCCLNILWHQLSENCRFQSRRLIWIMILSWPANPPRNGSERISRGLMNGLDFNTVEMSRVTLNSRDFDRSLSYVLQLKEFYMDSSGAMGELWGSGPSKKLAEFIQSYFYKHKYNYVVQVGNESVNDPHLQEVIVGITQLLPLLGLVQMAGVTSTHSTGTYCGMH